MMEKDFSAEKAFIQKNSATCVKTVCQLIRGPGFFFLEAIRRYILELIWLSNENIANEVIQDSSSTSDHSLSRSKVSVTVINIYIYISRQVVYSQLVF